MFRLEKISVQGFKSFKRQVSIPFNTGFSVITGPNGCGKSNIGDGISFVIGKSRSRILRAKKASDLIFHGSKMKPGADYAKVTLYFDNSEKVLPFDEKTVTISRRLNIKGVSTYRLNGKVVTRQNILDIFSQAGIHAQGHNIIQQGDVNQVVEMDSIERREIIDEISGIMEYDEKKQKAMSELAKIDEKVRDAELILTEKQSILEKLFKEREAAMRYKNLEADLQKIRASVVWKEYTTSEKSLSEISEKLEEKNKEMEQLEKSIDDYDKKLVEAEKGLEELTKDVLKASDQIEVTKRISTIRSEFEIKKDRIESKRREIERLNIMIDRLGKVSSTLNPAIKPVLKLNGVYGTLSSLIIVPKEYNVAVEVSAGSKLNDIVVDTTENAVKCVKYLKENRMGRARFLPLDKIRAPPKRELPRGAIGWLSELMHHEPRYSAAVDYVFSTTAAVKDIDRAREIARTQRVRMVTLDGDMIESSGAVTGGFYRKKGESSLGDVNKYMNEKRQLEEEISKLEVDLSRINNDLEDLASKEQKTKTTNLERDRAKLDSSLRNIREKRKECYERRLIVQQEIGKLNIQKARLEAKFDTLKLQWEENPNKSEWEKVKKSKNGEEDGPEGLKPFIELEISTLKAKERDVIVSIEEIGPVNMKSLDDFDSIKGEFDDFKEKVDKIVSEKKSIEDAIAKIEEKRMTTFMGTLNQISKNFKEVYIEMTNGEAQLELEDANNLASGLMISAQPPGKKLLNIDSMSGGEKTLTAFAFLFAIQRHKPSPFYILDEADAALDKVNTKKIAELIKKQSTFAQFIVISHNDALVREADQVYGVSMSDGESKIMAIELPPAVAGTSGQPVEAKAKTSSHVPKSASKEATKNN